MSLEENKAIIRRHVEEWTNKNPVAAIDELVATDLVSHDLDGDHVGIAEFRQFHIDQANTLPDRTYTITDMIAEGNKVAVMLEYQYTDPATGQKKASTGVNIYRISEGKMKELWPIWQAERLV